MHAPRVIERACVTLEAVGESAEQRAAGWAHGPRAGAVVLGHEAIGTLALRHVVGRGGDLLHALAEDAEHEHGVVADVPAHGHLAIRCEPRVVPERLRLQQEIDDTLQTLTRDAARKELLGAGEASQEVGQVRDGRVVVEGQVAEACSERVIEEAPKLHERIIANLARIPDVVADASKPRLPWLLVVASLALAALLGYTLFVLYAPAKQRIAGLERELREVYAREAELDTRQAQRERDLRAATAEREALTRRVEQLERELAAARNRR